MRGGIVLLGIMLLIIGVFLIGIGLEPIYKENTANIAKTVLVSGVVCGFLGLIICFVGFKGRIFKEKKVKNEPLVQINEKPSKDEAVDMVKVRYAKGEITEKQYKKMKKDLEK